MNSDRIDSFLENLSAEQALDNLILGNERYFQDLLKHPHEGAERRVELSQSQQPFAVILGCADSRVIPELIFDQGIGDLFTIRVAGNVTGDGVIASVEYAVEHLGTRLVVVLGHERCGAVTAAVKHQTSEGKINSLLRFIEPAVLAVQGQPGDLLTNVIHENTRGMVRNLISQEPILARQYKSGSLSIIPAYYNFTTGKVHFLVDLPLKATSTPDPTELTGVGIK